MATLTTEFLTEFARRYTDALALSKHPHKTLAAHYGAPPRTIERWAYLARKAGVLPRHGQGRTTPRCPTCGR